MDQETLVLALELAKSLPGTAAAQAAEAAQTAREVLDSIPQDYTALSAAVDEKASEQALAALGESGYEIDESLIPFETMIPGGINGDGVNLKSNGKNLRIDEYLPVINKEFTLRVINYTVAYFRFYDAEKQSLSSIQVGAGARETTVAAVDMKSSVPNAAFFRLTITAPSEESLSWKNVMVVTEKRLATANELAELTQQIAVLNSKTLPNYLSLFRRCVCIGDSLTRGYEDAYEQGERNRDGGYPTRLARMCPGLQVWNFGSSGATPTDWISNETFAGADYSQFDLALIMLGANGNLSSVEDVDAYQNIIQRLRSANEHITIFCLSMPNNSAPAAINSRVEAIAEATDTYYLDILTGSLCADTIYHPQGVHPNTLGYVLLAETIKRAIERYIDGHQSLFLDMYVPKTHDNVFTDQVE